MTIFLKDSFDGTAGVSIDDRVPTGPGAIGQWTEASGTSKGIKLNGAGGVSLVNVSIALFKSSDNYSENHYAQCEAGANLNSISFPLAVRYSNVSNWVGFRFNSGRYELLKYQSSSFVSIASAAGSYVAGDIFRLSCDGDLFVIEKNGTEILRGVDSFNNTRRNTGIVCRSDVEFDFIRSYESGSVRPVQITPQSDQTISKGIARGIERGIV